MPSGSDEVLFIALLLGLAIFILIVLLLGVVGILVSEHRRNAKVPFPSLVKIVTRLFTTPNASSGIEATSRSPASQGNMSSPQDEMKKVISPDKTVKRLLGFAMTVALMMGLTLALVLVNPTDKFYADMALEPWLWSFLRIFVGIAGGGAIGIRIAQLSWRQTVLTALLTSAVVMLVSGFETSPFYSGLWDFSERNFRYYMFLIGTLAVSAPVFLLPLYDPILRQNGPAPSRQKVLLVAFLITLMFVPFAQIAAGVFMGFTGFLLGIGVTLSLYRPLKSIGAEFGGLGLLLLPISSFIWLAYVSGSFS